MHYFFKPLLRAMRKMNDRQLLLSIIVGFLLFIAGVVDMLNIV
jgi:hypothetical protein